MLKIATLAIVLACSMSCGVETVAEAPGSSDLRSTEQPAHSELLADEGEDGFEAASCFNTTCVVGKAGNAYCTSLCGDVARCTAPMSSGCGTQPCCVVQ